MNKDLFVAVTFDTDSDIFEGADVASNPFSPLPWKGISDGIPLLYEHTHSIVDSYGSPLIFTWLVRADNQIKRIHDSSTFLLEEYNHIWKFAIHRGDEIGWHPHLYKLDDNLWVQETCDATNTRILMSTFEDLKKIDTLPISARVGETYCSNAIIDTFEKLGVMCDSSAMPGRSRKFKGGGVSWINAPSRPYTPSYTDYSKPCSQSRSILEVPLSMVPIKAPYDEDFYQRYVDLTFYHKFLENGLKKLVKESDLIVTISHPNTLLKRKLLRHGLLSFDIKEFIKNLNVIISECNKNGRNFRFISLKNCCHLFKNYVNS
ncbi:hypothetical protein VC178_01470 [Polynucleobacter sp. AP-Sanab-80-C2]|uniref:hypothetical protein n=1 Tax=Polynucleobacter sp. AP-Sanab-80-C2 TaxID=3108274 RepID=UPI002B2318F6|nr:hypothetical protein [Polynucleobacter sp. AP-Sanab-80-C2]MEA9598563.1 hypothetical protein [Polynucleobacter sp. AP-Sanab-80-C2]